MCKTVALVNPFSEHELREGKKIADMIRASYSSPPTEERECVVCSIQGLNGLDRPPSPCLLPLTLTLVQVLAVQNSLDGFRGDDLVVPHRKVRVPF